MWMFRFSNHENDVNITRHGLHFSKYVQCEILGKLGDFYLQIETLKDINTLAESAKDEIAARNKSNRRNNNITVKQYTTLTISLYERTIDDGSQFRAMNNLALLLTKRTEGVKQDIAPALSLHERAIN